MLSRRPALPLLLLLVISLLCCSCSVAPVEDDGSPLPDLLADDLQLRILPDTFIDGGRFDSISLSRAGANEYQVTVQGASGLKALYFEIRYDAALHSFQRARPTDFWGPEADYLTISIPGEPGYAEFGLVLIHPEERSGLSGSGAVATISFNQ